MPWDLLVFGLGSYFFGIWITKRDVRRKAKRPQWSSKYWGECSECYPGVVMKFGADHSDDLEKVMFWHREDHHKKEVRYNYKFDRSLLFTSSPYQGVYHPDTMILDLAKKGPGLKKQLDMSMLEGFKW